MLSTSLCLAVAIYFEARNQPTQGQIAVAQVVMNRARDEKRRWPKDACAVIAQPKQFSFYTEGFDTTPADKVLFWKIHDEVALPVARGQMPNIVGAAKWYARHEVQRPWMEGKRQQRIGDHIFYSEEEA